MQIQSVFSANTSIRFGLRKPPQYASPASFDVIPLSQLPSGANYRGEWLRIARTPSEREDSQVYKTDVLYALFRGWITKNQATLNNKRMFPSADAIAARLNMGLKTDQAYMTVSPTVVKMALIKLAAMHPEWVGSRKSEGVFVMPTNGTRVIVPQTEFETAFLKIREYLLRHENGFRFRIEANGHNKRKARRMPVLVEQLGLQAGAMVRENINGLIQEGALARRRSRKSSFTYIELINRDKLLALRAKQPVKQISLVQATGQAAHQLLSYEQQRKTTHVSRDDIATRLGVSTSTVRKLVAGLRSKRLISGGPASKSGYTILRTS